jgi:hypothetical protein
MKRFDRPAVLVLLACLFVAGPLAAQENFFRPALKDADITPTLRTDWYGVYLNDKKVGYVKTGRARIDDTIVETNATQMKLASFGKKAELKFDQTSTFEAKPPYRLLAATYEQDDGKVSKKIRAKRVENGFEYTIEASGAKRTRQVGDLEFTLADSLASELWIRSAPKVGEQILVKDLDVEDWKRDQTKFTIKNIKTSLVGGVEVKYSEVESESQKYMLKLLARHDSTGKMLSGFLAIFELRLEPEAQAKNTEYSQDLFVLGQAKVDQPLGWTTKLMEVVLRVDGKFEGLENGPLQTVVLDKDGSKLIKIGKKYGNVLRPTAMEIEENVAETNAYPISDPKIKAMALRAIGDAKAPEAKVRRIVSFVHGYIKPSLEVTVPNIHNLMDKQRGDCKSYALLTTNLCRAVGIPAREVSGLLYMGDDQKSFGGHAWNEVVLNGVWVPVDATLDQVEVDAGHISMGHEMKALGNMLKSLGKLSFKVVESRSSR